MLRGASYHLRLVVYRQTAIAPVLVFVGLVAAIYASPAGPPISAAAVPAVALMPVAAWLTRVVATAESDPYAEITLVSLGGALAQRRARASAVLAMATGLTVVSVVWAAVANDPTQYTIVVIAVIVAMCLAEAIAGIGLGLLLGPPLPVATTVLSLTALVVLSLVTPWLPPLNPVVHVAEATGTPPWTTLTLVIVQAALVGVAAAIVSAVIAREPIRHERGR